MATSRSPLVAGNWKMNGSRTSVTELMTRLIDAGPYGCEVLVIPPFVYLPQVKQLVEDSTVLLGAQDVDFRDKGAFTGEVSAAMLRDVGCEYCLVGHSERRALFGESDEVVANKFDACIANDLTPILCVGETLEERQGDRTMAVVTRQLRAVVDRVGMNGLAKSVIAYEPVWAIGTGESATPAMANEVHGGIRAFLHAENAAAADRIRILYGGSVNGENAAALMAQPDIDGALVGGASLKAEEFASICRAAA